MDQYIGLLETTCVTWCVEAHEGRTTGVCVVPSDRLKGGEKC